MEIFSLRVTKGGYYCVEGKIRENGDFMTAFYSEISSKFDAIDTTFFAANISHEWEFDYYRQEVKNYLIKNKLRIITGKL